MPARDPDAVNERAGALTRITMTRERRGLGPRGAAAAGLAVVGLALVGLLALARAGLPASVLGRGPDLFEPVVVELEVRGVTVGDVDITPDDMDLDALLAVLDRDVAPTDLTVRRPLPVRAQLMTDARTDQLELAVAAVDPDQVTDDPAVAMRFASVDPSEPAGARCRPARGVTACADPARWYCDAVDGRCHRRVPVIVSPSMADRFRRAIEAGAAPDGVVNEIARATGGPLVLALGRPTTPANCAPAPLPLRVGVQVVGVSAAAAHTGITVPTAHAAAWQRALTGSDELPAHGTVKVVVAHRHHATALVERLRRMRWVEVQAVTPAPPPGPPLVAGAALREGLARLDGITTEMLLLGIRSSFEEPVAAPIPPLPCDEPRRDDDDDR